MKSNKQYVSLSTNVDKIVAIAEIAQNISGKNVTKDDLIKGAGNLNIELTDDLKKELEKRLPNIKF